MSDNYNNLKKDELLDLLTEKDQELAEVQKLADDALARLSRAESNAGTKRPETEIDADKNVKYLFIGRGFRSSKYGIVTAQLCKEKPEIAVELHKGGCEFVQKI